MKPLTRLLNYVRDCKMPKLPPSNAIASMVSNATLPADEKLTESFLQTMGPVQLELLNQKAAAAGLARTAYVRAALYHYMNCPIVNAAEEL